MANVISSGPLIEARGLTKHYDGFSLKEVNLSVGEGEVVGFVGQNGAGKSTTIKALLGVIGIDGGEASILGTLSDKLTRPSGAATKERIGVVFDAMSLPGHVKIADVERIHAHAYTTWDAQYFSKLIADLGLSVDKRVKDLSRGMGMKLSLACALAHHPQVLILDEATAGLDPMARDEALDRLRDFMAEPGRAILMSSHITSDLERIADRIVCIDDGRIVFDKPKDEITDEAGIARCRKADFERVAASGVVLSSDLRCLHHEYGIDLLVPDRFAFAKSFPEIPVDRMTIDDYMAFTLKGGVR
ncbi:ABC transporter ATP-binding protein [Adlercreutzia sp. ZJ141]|uniref:ABC transporter ATP-binding protein n=1 Tax=Adlercreutzia sp. ZJ141 TaxID=2709406 RepID=UPI0013ED8223|nr:ABC transporter ATP-binding protein [Adlercreutzia sp. ZJ141]